MGRKRSDVTETELAVLQVLWERGPATRRQIADVLYPGAAAASYTTVQKLLERLQGKRYVTRRTAGEAVVFSAAVGRDELINRRLRDMAEKLCGGSLTPLLMNLVRSGPLTPGELKELQELLRQHQGRSTKN